MLLSVLQWFVTNQVGLHIEKSSFSCKLNVSAGPITVA